MARQYPFLGNCGVGGSLGPNDVYKALSVQLTSDNLLSYLYAVQLRLRYR